MGIFNYIEYYNLVRYILNLIYKGIKIFSCYDKSYFKYFDNKL